MRSGGAISVTMKNGFTYQGAELELSGGSYGQRAVTAQYGVNSGAFGFYVAGRALDWDGWRRSPTIGCGTCTRVFSVHTDAATLDLSYTRADNEMNGQGPAPVQELAVNRSLVFTGPQTNINTLNFLTLNGTLQVTRHLVAAERALLPAVHPDRLERQHHQLRGLHATRPASCASPTASRRSRTRPGKRCPTSPMAARCTSAKTTSN